LYLVAERLYGKPYDTIKREILSYIDRRLKSVDGENEHLNSSRHITQDMFTEGLKAAEPTLLVDMTCHTYRRGIFVLGPLRDSQAMLARAISETGIQCDREKFAPIQGANDEAVIMMYDKGVPLESIKSLRDCKKQYDSDPERYKGHLEPLYELLPDPMDDIDSERYKLMGMVSGAMTETSDGYVYRDLDGHFHKVNDPFFDYGRAVEVSSRFIQYVKSQGFERVINQVGRHEIAGILENLSEIYR
jgi:hypothetical protein